MASLSPQEFVQQILVRVLQSRLVVVGEDFRFGHRRAGDIGLLTSLGEQHGFQTEAVSEVVEGGLKVSSSRVRQALADGDLGLVRRLLGRPYTLSGRVRYGQQLGRKLGFPTLNLAMPDDLVAIGIFAVRVHGLSREPLPGVASLGRRPTVESNGRLLLEVHVLDWDGLAYGQAVQVEMVERLRGEKTFDHLDAMIEQMHQDLAQARQRLQP
ncbi:MAG: bifunctional riboflavin kinase/FMN adenylyltransferase [Pseudomonadota bacterium]